MINALKWYSVTVLINKPHSPRKFKKFILNFFPEQRWLRKQHYSFPSTDLSFPLIQRDKISSRCFFPNEAPSSLQTRIPPDLQKKEMANEYPQVNLSVHSTHLFKKLCISLLQLNWFNLYAVWLLAQNSIFQKKSCNGFETNACILVLPFLHSCMFFLLKWMQLLREYLSFI